MRTIKAMALVGTILVMVCSSVKGQTSAEAPASTPNIWKNTANYVVRVQWREGAKSTNHLQVTTSEGNFSLDTLMPDRVKINDSEIPVTASLKGDLTVLSPEKGRLRLFLGRTVPYVTSTYGVGKDKASSYQQMQVGLSSTFTVTFGKPLVVQSDAKEEIIVSVTRVD